MMRNTSLFMLVLALFHAVFAHHVASAAAFPVTPSRPQVRNAQNTTRSAALTPPKPKDAPVEVSVVRSVDYREAAVAGGLALIVAIMRLLSGATVSSLDATATRIAVAFAVLITLCFTALSIVLPILVEEQNRYAWQWFHAVCPFVLIMPLPLIFFRGSCVGYGSESAGNISIFDQNSNNNWLLSMRLLFRELSMLGRAAFVLVWVSWISLAAYLQAWDSIVFYIATALALELGLSLPVALRPSERQVLAPGYANGIEVQVGVFEGILRTRLMRLIGSGVETSDFPAHPSSLHQQDNPGLGLFEHRIPLLSSRANASPVFDSDMETADHKVIMRGVAKLSSTAPTVHLVVPCISKESFPSQTPAESSSAAKTKDGEDGSDEIEINESDASKGNSSTRNKSVDGNNNSETPNESDALLNLGEIYYTNPESKSETSSEVLMEMPEDLCGVIATIASSLYPHGSLASCLVWDDALRLGKALSAHRIIDLETGGFIGADAPDLSTGSEASMRINLPISKGFDRNGFIDLSMTTIGTNTDVSSHVSDAGSQADVAAFSWHGDVDVRSSDTAWNWLCEERRRGSESFLRSIISLWSTLNQINELHTVVEHQHLWARMWLASRNGACVHEARHGKLEAERLYRLTDRVMEVASQFGGWQLANNGLRQCLVVPTPALVLLVLVIGVNEACLRRVLDCKDKAEIDKFRSSSEGSSLLTSIGNLLWLSTFAIPRSEQIEKEVSETVLRKENDVISGAIDLENHGAVLRALRIDLEVITGHPATTLMHVMILALAFGVQRGLRKDSVHIGQCVYDVVAQDVDMSNMCGVAGSPLLGALGGPTWDLKIDSRVATARETIRTLIIRRLSVVALSTAGTLAALSLISALL